MAVTQLTSREERGQAIVSANGQINRIDELLYIVKSQSGNGEYTVNKINGEWVCDCPDNTYRHVQCKHIHAVIFSQAVRAEVKARTIQPLTNLSACIYCGSQNIVKDGVRKNKSGNIQIFECRNCHHYFTYNIGFQHMKHNPQAITTAMNLYFCGESFRNTQKSLKYIGVEVSHKTIYKWVQKYTAIMKEYVETLKPNVSDAWRADEIYMKISGNLKYLFSMMDDETRFWIAQEVADTKDKHDARTLLKMSKELMGKQPKVFITDGLHSYHKAYKQEFFTVKKPRTEHIRHITLKGDRNNNKMERLNGEIRDREKTMRGIKNMDTSVLQGFQIYHNFVRPHMALDGKTPAEACGITVEGENKWITLIQNASKKQKLPIKNP